MAKQSYRLIDLLNFDAKNGSGLVRTLYIIVETKLCDPKYIVQFFKDVSRDGLDNAIEYFRVNPQMLKNGYTDTVEIKTHANKIKQTMKGKKLCLVRS